MAWDGLGILLASTTIDYSLSDGLTLASGATGSDADGEMPRIKASDPNPSASLGRLGLSTIPSGHGSQ